MADQQNKGLNVEYGGWRLRMKNADMKNVNDVEAASGIEAVKKDLAELINIYEENNLKSLPYGKCFEKTLKMLERAEKEFKANLFFILMFGPLKAGKSTLTNLLARKYVSPTGFGIETTLRPSLIIKSRELGIDVYEAVDTKDDQEELFNLVIDVLRGISDDRSIKSRVRKQSYEWSKETVQKQLIRRLEIEPLITVLKVPGGDLLTEQIALIDMPGLDGVKSNWEDSYIHKWILKRADFLIFIQSSMAALNKSTLDFLKDAYLRSRKPPLWLVQNVIDAKHWRSGEERDAENDEQRQGAKEYITNSLGISEDLRSTAINLGQAWDGSEEPKRFGDLLKQSRFPEFEKNLKELLNESRIRIQQENSVKGVRTAVNNCKQEFENYREELNSLDEEYAEQIRRLTKPQEIYANISKAIKAGVMKDSLKGKGRLAEQVEAWKGHCALELSDENLLKNLSSQAKQDELEQKMKKAVDAINDHRKEDYLEESSAYKDIIDETTKEILERLAGGYLISLNDCLKELQITPFEEEFHFEPEFKSSSFEPNISKMIKDTISFNAFKKMKEKNFANNISALRGKLREEYSDYAGTLLKTMIDKISADFDVWIQHSYKDVIGKYLRDQTDQKKDEMEQERGKIAATLDYIKTLEQKCDDLAQSCDEVLA